MAHNHNKNNKAYPLFQLNSFGFPNNLHEKDQLLESQEKWYWQSGTSPKEKLRNSEQFFSKYFNLHKLKPQIPGTFTSFNPSQLKPAPCEFNNSIFKHFKYGQAQLDQIRNVDFQTESEFMKPFLEKAKRYRQTKEAQIGVFNHELNKFKPSIESPDHIILMSQSFNKFMEIMQSDINFETELLSINSKYDRGIKTDASDTTKKNVDALNSYIDLLEIIQMNPELIPFFGKLLLRSIYFKPHYVQMVGGILNDVFSKQLQIISMFHIVIEQCITLGQDNDKNLIRKHIKKQYHLWKCDDTNSPHKNYKDLIYPAKLMEFDSAWDFLKFGILTYFQPQRGSGLHCKEYIDKLESQNADIVNDAMLMLSYIHTTKLARHVIDGIMGEKKISFAYNNFFINSVNPNWSFNWSIFKKSKMKHCIAVYHGKNIIQSITRTALNVVNPWIKKQDYEMFGTFLNSLVSKGMKISYDHEKFENLLQELDQNFQLTDNGYSVILRKIITWVSIYNIISVIPSSSAAFSSRLSRYCQIVPKEPPSGSRKVKKPDWKEWIKKEDLEYLSTNSIKEYVYQYIESENITLKTRRAKKKNDADQQSENDKYKNIDLIDGNLHYFNSWAKAFGNTSFRDHCIANKFDDDTLRARFRFYENFDIDQYDCIHETDKDFIKEFDIPYFDDSDYSAPVKFSQSDITSYKFKLIRLINHLIQTNQPFICPNCEPDELIALYIGKDDFCYILQSEDEQKLDIKQIKSSFQKIDKTILNNNGIQIDADNVYDNVLKKVAMHNFLNLAEDMDEFDDKQIYIQNQILLQIKFRQGSLVYSVKDYKSISDHFAAYFSERNDYINSNNEDNLDHILEIEQFVLDKLQGKSKPNPSANVKIVIDALDSSEYISHLDKIMESQKFPIAHKKQKHQDFISMDNFQHFSNWMEDIYYILLDIQTKLSQFFMKNNPQSLQNDENGDQTRNSMHQFFHSWTKSNDFNQFKISQSEQLQISQTLDTWGDNHKTDPIVFCIDPFWYLWYIIFNKPFVVPCSNRNKEITDTMGRYIRAAFDEEYYEFKHQSIPVILSVNRSTKYNSTEIVVMCHFFTKLFKMFPDLFLNFLLYFIQTDPECLADFVANDFVDEYNKIANDERHIPEESFCGRKIWFDRVSRWFNNFFNGNHFGYNKIVWLKSMQHHKETPDSQYSAFNNVFCGRQAYVLEQIATTSTPFLQRIVNQTYKSIYVISVHNHHHVNNFYITPDDRFILGDPKSGIGSLHRMSDNPQVINRLENKSITKRFKSINYIFSKRCVYNTPSKHILNANSKKIQIWNSKSQTAIWKEKMLRIYKEVGLIVEHDEDSVMDIDNFHNDVLSKLYKNSGDIFFPYAFVFDSYCDNNKYFKFSETTTVLQLSIVGNAFEQLNLNPVFKKIQASLNKTYKERQKSSNDNNRGNNRSRFSRVYGNNNRNNQRQYHSPKMIPTYLTPIPVKKIKSKRKSKQSNISQSGSK